MRVFCDFSLNIVGIFPDDQEVNLPGCFEITVPKDITAKRDKTVSYARQKRDANGQLVFDKTQAVMEEAQFTRKVGLKESASEWTLNEVLEEKYKLLANGKDFWFEEFINDSAINHGASIVNTGVGAVSIPPSGVLQLSSIQLSKAVKQFNLYVEGADGLSVEYSVDGGSTFSPVNPNGEKLAKKTDTFIFRIENNNAKDTPSIAVFAIAIFF